MPTDNERREVARRLRDMRLDPWDDAACEIAQCAGIACCNSECHGSDETPECTMALADRLADLIEPSGHECVPGECPLNVRHDNDRIDRERLLAIAKWGTSIVPKETIVDRDALLALAEDVDGAADDSGGFEPLAGMLRDIAHRIREALGVES